MYSLRIAMYSLCIARYRDVLPCIATYCHVLLCIVMYSLCIARYLDASMRMLKRTSEDMTM